MTWSLWQPAKVVNVQATLVDGGTLEANTTYYIRVQALDNGTTSRPVPFYAWSGAHIAGPYSDIVSITTDSTKRSIALTWDKVFKIDETTEVNAYEVLVTTDPADFDLEYAKLTYALIDYRAPLASTNNLIITAPANVFYSRIPHGVPLLTWDGAGTATFEDLHEWLTSNGYTQFTAILPTAGPAAVAYRFIGHIKIMPETAGGYAHTMHWQNVTILGGLDVGGCRVSWKNSLLNVFTRPHGGGTSLMVNAAGSTIEGVALWNAMAPADILAPYPARGWFRYVPAFLPKSAYETFRTNLIGYGSNTAIDLLQSQPVLRPDIGTGIRSALTWRELLQNLAQGQHLVSSEYMWGMGSPAWCMELSNNYEFWQFPGGQLVDCVTNAENYYGKTGITFDRRVEFSGYYGKDFGNAAVALFRRLRIVVLDENNAPLQGVRVSIRGAGGQNLTIGYKEADLTWLGTGYRTDGKNWQRAEETIKHDDTNVWLYKNTSLGSAQPEAGKSYWVYGERLRLVEQLQIDGNWELWRTERGLTNTIPGWLNTWGNSMPLIAAPDFHTTGAAGEAWNVTPLIVYKHAYDNPKWEGWLFDVPGSVGTLTYYAPITVKVEADGYQTWEATYSLELLEGTGVKPFVVVARMEPVTPPVVVQSLLSANLQEVKSLSASLQEIEPIEVELNV